MLDDTLVIWGGELAEPTTHKENLPKPTMAEITILDVLQYGWQEAVPKPDYNMERQMNLDIISKKNPVHVHDFQATLMHLLGIDHERLTYKFQGRRFRLTDVHGKLIPEILS